VVTLGLTVMFGVVAPVLHRNDTPPAAVSVCEPPGQIVTGGQIEHVGPGVTVTVVEQELVQPFASVTVTVYVVVTVGVTVIEAVVAALLQRNDVPPAAVSVDGPPEQLVGLTGVMLHTTGLPTWLTTTSAKQLSTVLVTVKRYVPGAVIRIESKPFTVSLIPAPRGALFNVHMNIGFTKSV
jgi:hypothetical protein